MILDLRKSGSLPIRYAKQLSGMEVQIRAEYNSFIGEVADANGVHGLAWTLQVLSRNTNISQILDSMCRLALLESILEHDEVISEVHVDSQAIGKTAKEICEKFSSNSKIVVANNEKSSIFGVMANLFKVLYLSIVSYVVPKIISGREIPNDPIILLDTFLFTNSFSPSGEYQDRYYTGIDAFPDCGQGIGAVWYSPTLYRVNTYRKMIDLFRSVRSSRHNFLMVEDWVSLVDYIKAIYWSFFLPYKISFVPKWRGYSVEALVKAENRSDRLSTSLFHAYLKYMFFYRLKKPNIEIRMIVDWFENQVIDRALNLSVKKNFPNVMVKGYQGYSVPDFFACKDPTEYEYEAGLIPDSICVPGPVFFASKSNSSRFGKLEIAPAFRFQGVFDNRYIDCDKREEVLVALPISISDSKNLARLCVDAIRLLGSKYKFIVKQHPSYSSEDILKLIPDFNSENFVFATHPLHEHLCRAQALLSSASSVCIEGVSLGTTVIIAGNLSGPTMNPLDGVVPDHTWVVAYSGEDVVEALTRVLSRGLKPDDIFTHVNVNTVGAFLALDS